ncbi:hypothetical protein E1301_Tti011426 [Triplophysa tibetana]|uniref:Uncharacterized protein n=1 Tax=Triplophysa tibetana TaxID=1572043 RepID=A0A5A9PAW4_9TELE|nr:hypothetical protein E1301_Tti011426 [Triplophysa tibetana]
MAYHTKLPITDRSVPWGCRVHSVWRPVLASHNTDVWADAIWGSEDKTKCGGAVQGIQEENGKLSDGRKDPPLGGDQSALRITLSNAYSTGIDATSVRARSEGDAHRNDTNGCACVHGDFCADNLDADFRNNHTGLPS